MPEPYQALISDEKEKDSPDFKYNDEATPFATQGKEIAQLIRKKAASEEFAPLLESIEQEAAAAGMPDPQLASTDAFMTSICWVGSKSMSHVIACIERSKERLLEIGNGNPTARKQIITSVMEYWKFQQGVGGVILDKLLNYNILTPASVVEWALIDHVQHGTFLASAWGYELISNTARKVANRVKSVVDAIRQPGLDDEQSAQLQQALAQEQEDMKALFTTIEEAVVSLRDGHQDERMESSEEDEAMLKAWSGKWVRVFQRRYAVEESWVREELAKPIPVVEEPAPAPTAGDALMNEAPSAAATNGAGENGTVMVDDDGIE